MIKKILAAGVMLAAMQGCGSDSDSSSDTPETAALGPGAALKCTSSGMNAWDTYGVDGFVAVNKAIVANVVSELTANGSDNLGDSFSKIGSGMPASTSDDMATFEGKLAAFLVYAYGGPTSIKYTDGKMYSGLQDMGTAHIGLAITSDQYDYFVSNQIVPALTSSGVTGDDVSKCFAPIVTDKAFKASIVGH
ncbi:MAG: hypothetical protein ABIQ16_18700 [Polyangiaceae bacterium]